MRVSNFFGLTASAILFRSCYESELAMFSRRDLSSCSTGLPFPPPQSRRNPPFFLSFNARKKKFGDVPECSLVELVGKRP